MELLPSRLVQQTLRMSGSGHSYLKQLCLPEAALLREDLGRRLDSLPAVLQDRYSEMLVSLDNRKFFQAFSEVTVLGALQESGWLVRGWASPYVQVEHPARGSFSLSVLAFLQQRRPGGEEGLHQRLVESLGRVSARNRFAVLVRRWLPPDLDPEPVRRALELWLAQVSHGQWQGRYATYEDERLALEFCLTGESVEPGQSALAFSMGPFYGHRTMEAMEPRVVAELDRYAASTRRRTPLLLACVTDQPWLMNDGYLLDFLYGRPDGIRSGDGPLTRDYEGAPGVCLFRDPLYPFLSGLWMMDRRPSIALGELRLRVCLNPWAQSALTPEDVAFRSYAEKNREGGRRSLCWFEGRGSVLRLGAEPG